MYQFIFILFAIVGINTLCASDNNNLSLTPPDPAASPYAEQINPYENASHEELQEALHTTQQALTEKKLKVLASVLCIGGYISNVIYMVTNPGSSLEHALLENCILGAKYACAPACCAYMCDICAEEEAKQSRYVHAEIMKRLNAHNNEDHED